jgi:hypothetical protein
MEKMQICLIPNIAGQAGEHRVLSGHSNGAGVALMRTSLMECPSENHHTHR